MVKAASNAFFEGVYPVRAHVWGMDKGITVERNSKPVLTRRNGEVLLSQQGITSTASNTAIRWHLYLQFSSTAPSNCSINLATSIKDQTYFQSVTLVFSNSTSVPQAFGVATLTMSKNGLVQEGGIGTFYVTLKPFADSLSNYVLECNAEELTSNRLLSSRLRFRYSIGFNLAYPNVYNNRGECSGNRVNFGKVLSPYPQQSGDLLLAEFFILADISSMYQGSVNCELKIDNVISRRFNTIFFSTPTTVPLVPTPLNSSTWTLKVIDVFTQTPLSRPLLPGEVALIEFEFTVPPNTAVNAKPSIEIASGGDATLDSPHIRAVGDSVYWGDNYQNCIAADAKHPRPVSKYTFNMGTLLAKDEVSSKVTVASYMRVKFTTNPTPVITVKASLKHDTLTKVIAVSSTSNISLGRPFATNDISLSLAGPNVIKMMPKEWTDLRLRFCAEPKVYLNDLQFEAYSENDTYEEEVLTVNHLWFSASANYPGINYAPPVVMLHKRKPSGQVWRRSMTFGPVLNSGHAYWEDLRKPERDADCITLGVRIQLTSGRGAVDGSRYGVVVKVVADAMVTLTDRVDIAVREAHNPFLDVDLGLISQPS
uniref:Cadherin domain-containing protein n=1 Tax=Mesocestoides corti TaxID=53468 RepID=A0A5K3FV25_MESCO